MDKKEIAGVVVGAVVGFILLVYLLYVFYKRCRCCRNSSSAKPKHSPHESKTSRSRSERMKGLPNPHWKERSHMRSTLKRNQEDESTKAGPKRSETGSDVKVNIDLKTGYDRRPRDQTQNTIPEMNEHIEDVSTISVHSSDVEEAIPKFQELSPNISNDSKKKTFSVNRENIRKMLEELKERNEGLPSYNKSGLNVGENAKTKLEATDERIECLRSLTNRLNEDIQRSKTMREPVVKTQTVTTQTRLKWKNLKKSQFSRVNEITGVTESDITSESSSNAGHDVKPSDKYRNDRIEPIIVPFRRHSESSTQSGDYFGAYSRYPDTSSVEPRVQLNNLLPRMERIIDMSFDNIIKVINHDFDKLEAIEESE